MSPAEQLRAIFRDTIRHSRRGLVDVDVVAKARAAYAAVDDADEKRSAFHAYARYGVKLVETPPGPVAATFVIGDDGEPWVKVAGFDSGRRWNGWASPLVDIDGLREFVKQESALDLEGERYLIDEDLPGLVRESLAADGTVDERFVVEGDPIVCDDRVERHLFDIGLGLVWEVAEPTEVES